MQDNDGEKRIQKKGAAPQPAFVLSVSTIFRMLVTFGLVLICVRLPLILWIKIPLLIGLLLAGWKWTLRTQSALRIAPSGAIDHFKEGRAAEAGKNYEEAIRHYEIAAGNPPEPNHVTVRLLVAYDRAGQLGRAKTLIQQMNGRKFPDSSADELEEVAEKYFPIRIRKTAGGSQLVLS